MKEHLRKSPPRGHWGELLGFAELQWHIRNVLAFTRLNRVLEGKEIEI